MLCIGVARRSTNASTAPARAATQPKPPRQAQVAPNRQRAPRRRARGSRPIQTRLPHTDLVPNFSGTFHGGKRTGAGRPKTGRAVGVVHRRRSDVKKSLPIHVTTRFAREVGYLRTHKVYRVIRRALAAACQRRGFRICHFSLQRNHLHLIIEADSPAQLHKGMTGLLVRIARTLNRLRGRSGQVFPDRYHHAVKRTPTDVRNALRYVLANARHHAHPVHDKHRLAAGYVDPFSSAPYFDGWSPKSRPHVSAPEDDDDPTAAPRSWLLTTGWRRLGLLRP